MYNQFPGSGSGEFPLDSEEFLNKALLHGSRLNALKKDISLSWYPFDSLTALPLLTDILDRNFNEIRAAIKDRPVLDLGCADGDLACVFSLLGSKVDALDSGTTNFNQMDGVRSLVEASGTSVRVFDRNLDEGGAFPDTRYGLTLFLGTLYHLKNPYSLLERLAYCTEWCVLSTRIAQLTPRVKAPIDMEPVAYLADGREVNNDSTNYWIFSAAGLLRLLQRTRWAVWGDRRVGCLENSNPIDNDADERMFVLLQSRVFQPHLHVRRAEGWYLPEGRNWCWTAKRFTIEVVLPLETHLSGFNFELYIPEQIVARDPIGGVRVSCAISNTACGSALYTTSGTHQFAGTLPPFSLHEPRLVITFWVESGYAGDGRELGVCVCIKPSDSANDVDLPFTVF